MTTEKKEKNKPFLIALTIAWTLALTMLAVVVPRLH